VHKNDEKVRKSIEHSINLIGLPYNLMPEIRLIVGMNSLTL
jgi:hypothetical protein